MINTPEQAIARARSLHRPGTFGTGTCLMQVRRCFNVAAKFPSAATAWAGAQDKHETSSSANIPRGVPVFWTGGSKGFGHIAISLGGGLCETTDFVNRGGFGVAAIDDITRRWGLKFLGWTSDLNGVEVWKAPVIEKPAAKPDPKKVPQATHWEAFKLGVLALWDEHGRHIQAKYGARVRAARAAVAAVNAGPPVRKGVKVR